MFGIIGIGCGDKVVVVFIGDDGLDKAVGICEVLILVRRDLKNSTNELAMSSHS